MQPIDVASGLKLVITLLENSKMEYMIVGSVAGSIYGEPRLTRDLDLVVALSPGDVQKFPVMFDSKDFYVPPQEIISQEATRGGFVNLLHHASGLKVDLVFRKYNRHALMEFTRKKRIEVLHNLSAWVAAPEDVIIAKLRYYREGESEKHLIDIRGILANTPIDQKYLDDWISELELTSCFAKIK